MSRMDPDVNQVTLRSTKCIANVYDGSTGRDVRISDFVCHEHFAFFLVGNLLMGTSLNDTSATSKFLLLENVISFGAGSEYLVALESSGTILACNLSRMDEGFYQISLEPAGGLEVLLSTPALMEAAPAVKIKLFEAEGIAVLFAGRVATVYQLVFSENENENVYEGMLLVQARLASNAMDIESVALWSTSEDQLILVCVSKDGDIHMVNISAAYAEHQEEWECCRKDNEPETSPSVCFVELFCHSSLESSLEKRWSTAISRSSALTPQLIGASGDSSGTVTVWKHVERPRGEMYDNNGHDLASTAFKGFHLIEGIVELNVTKHLITALEIIPASKAIWVGDAGGSVTELYLDEDDEQSLLSARKIHWQISCSIISIQWSELENSTCGRLRYLCLDEGTVIEALLSDTVELALSLSLDCNRERGSRNYISSCTTVSEADVCIAGSVSGTAVDVWDLADCKVVANLPLALATPEYGGGVAGPCTCLAAHPVHSADLQGGRDVNVWSRGEIDCIIVAIGQARGHLSLYALVDASKLDISDDSASHTSSIHVSPDPVTRTVTNANNVNETEPVSEKSCSGKQGSLLDRALGGDRLSKSQSRVDGAIPNTTFRVTDVNGTSKKTALNNQQQRQAARSMQGRQSKGSVHHSSILDIIEESSSHSQVPKRLSDRTSRVDLKSKDRKKRSASVSSGSAKRNVSRSGSESSFLTVAAGNSYDDGADAISAMSSVDSETRPSMDPEGGGFSGIIASNDEGSEFASVVEAVSSGWKLRNRISIDRHCGLPITDIFFSSLGGYVAVCYGRRAIVLHSLLQAKAVFQMELKNSLTDISAVKMTIREDASAVNENTYNSYSVAQGLLNEDQLILVLSVESDIRLLNVMTKKFLPPVDLSYLGQSISTTGSSFWCIESMTPAHTQPNNNILASRSFDDTSAYFSASQDFSVSARYGGIYVSEAGEVFYIDPSRELRRRLAENVLPADSLDDPLNNVLVGVNAFSAYLNSPSLVLAVSWQHSVLLKRLIVGMNPSTDTDIAATSAIQFRVNQSDRTRVVHIGHLRSTSRCRTARIVIVLSDGSFFVVRV